MARKKQMPTNEVAADPPVEQVPVVTPEIEDGYDGVIKRLMCAGCLRVFYLTDADYQSIHPTHCHPCSVKLVAEYEAKRQKERTEQEQKAKDAIIRAIVTDLVKQREDTPEEAFVREHIEIAGKKDWNYGYTMLLCTPLHNDKTRAWDVVLTKDEEHPKRSTHIRVLIIEMSKNFYFHLPYSKSVFYETSAEEDLADIDKLIQREPEEALYYSMKADKLVELGDDQQALQYYDKAIARDPSNALNYCHKGEIFVRLDQAGEAMKCYEQAIRLDPDDVYGYMYKAKLLDQLGRDEEALGIYDAFIAAHPTDLEGYLQKALWYISHDQYEEARETHLQGKRASQKTD